jgi:hypothetical protein
LSIRSPTINMTRKSDGHEASMTDSPGSIGLDLNIKIQDFDFPGGRFGATVFVYSGLFRIFHGRKAVCRSERRGGEDPESGQFHRRLLRLPRSEPVPPRMPSTAPHEKPVSVGLGAGKGTIFFKGDAVFGPTGRSDLPRFRYALCA